MKLRMSLRPTTPKKITQDMRLFLTTAGLLGDPLFIRHTRVSAHHKPGYCLDNCEQEAQKRGAEVVFGWVVWEDRRAHFIVAEFHAVIRKSGSLIDITPRVDGEKRVLFIEDPIRVARRVGPKEWDTWSNFKWWDGAMEYTSQIRIVDEPALADA